MSFEGYHRWLCKKGHLHYADVYDTDHPFPMGPWDDGKDKENWRCPSCNEPMAWWEIVDQTNDEGNPTPLDYNKPPVQCVCSCGHVHNSEEATYKIPKDAGHLV